MRRIGIIAVIGVAAVAATAQPAVTQPGPRCGGQLWRMKTLNDGARRSVALAPRQTTIKDLVLRRFPRALPRIRRTPFQRQVWELVAQVVEYRLDGPELRLVLYDDGMYMNAVLPSPACLGRGTRARDEIAKTWSFFVAKCGHPQKTWQPLGAVVFIRGVGFWSSRFASRRRAAPNGVELHPVTGFRPVVGCG